jgi:telomere length regulation protein
MSNASGAAGQVAISAYSILLSTLPLSPHAIHILDKLSVHYTVDRLYIAAVRSKGSDKLAKEREWGDCVTNLVKVPGKVANALGLEGEIPAGLESATFFNKMAMRSEALISTLASGKKFKGACI